MRPITHRFTLDMHDTQSQISIPVYCGDSGRKLFITLSEGGKPYEIGEGCCAYINARTPANTTQSLMCNIANNTIEFDFSENNDAVNMIAVVGLTHCDVTLFDADGYIVTAPRFTFVVVDQISNPRNVELSSGDVSLLSNWEAIFAGWARAENTRHDNEDARQTAETAREDAESVRNLSEDARNINESARRNAENERQQTYEEAKESLDTVIAKANEAKTSADESESSARRSASSAVYAESCKNEAKESEKNAKASASSAQKQVSLANNYAASAATSAIGAKNAETNAKTSEENAKRIADEVRSAAEATPAYLDYLAHYNYRVQQITADVGTKFSDHYDLSIGDMEGKRGIAMLPISGFDGRLWEGQGYEEYPYAIMHPKTTGVQTFETAGSVKHILVAKGVTEITWINSNVGTVDLTLFTGDMPFPTLGGSANNKVLVQIGRKAELSSMTNWSGCRIEEVETW